MILFDNIVEIPSATHKYRLPLKILETQQSQGQMARQVSVQINGAGPLTSLSDHGLAEKNLRRVPTAICAEIGGIAPIVSRIPAHSATPIAGSSCARR
jgi:hypothetical protein